MKWLHIALIVAFLIVSAFYANNHAKAETTAQQGVIDLQTWDSLNETVDLRGEWEFYWEQLLEPSDFDGVSRSPQYAHVPDLWATYSIAGAPLSSQGYATYRLTFTLSHKQIESNSTLGLYFKRVETAYRVWINGEEKGGNGTVGTTSADTIPRNYPQVIYFEAQPGKNELIIQVSNFHHRHGGMWERLHLGNAETITYIRTFNVTMQSFVIGLFIMMAIYFMFIYFFRKSEKTSLIFSFLCFFITIRISILGESTALYLFPYLSWEWVSKMEYLSVAFAAIMLVFFIHYEYPKESVRFIPIIISIMLLIFSIFVLSTPAIIFTNYIFMFTWFMLFPAILYTLYIYIASAIHKRRGSTSNAIGFAFFFLFALNDILFYNDIIHTGDYLSYGLLIFLFTQAINLSSRFSKALNDAEQLSNKLQQSNELLEMKVEERTAKLKQAEMFRTQLLSTISHELGTPITSIKGYSKALRDGIITQNASKYADRIFERTILLERLIDDLVELTKLETRQVDFQFKRTEARSFFKLLYEKYEWEFLEKDLHFSFEERNPLPATQQAEMVIDPFRIEQVYSNLLTNAIKFSPAKEAIRVILEWQLPSSTKVGQVILHIVDSGIGIDPSEHEMIFKRFYQTKKENGSGLGLAISKEIIDYHKGELHVNSQLNKGSDFYFSLPVQFINEEEKRE
ncbi:sensor histidine kinase [Alkalihalobacillus hemicellulosilyticus]|uniref:histidine kinase n=1 Tax=Halalkalibacter hemicellulosilyticusJCM 9152 TaxID=1236971 RepID=W4QBH8_9BACI|nr:ATP-binding protein [Halalkalibacter hemicellulosilyticus]GAE28749.1 phosphate regulon sensor protein PhoR [Halalkalibacter hemicellulosilyticusJCM 9152]